MTMKLSTIQEAINSEVDEPVLAIRGKLSKLFTRMSGESQYGQWTLQNGQLEENGLAIKIVFSNRDEIPGDWRNQIVELRCQKGAKGGWSGVKRTIDKKDKTPSLTITDKGEVILFKAEHEPEPGQDTHTKPPATPANGNAKAPGSPQGASQPSGSGVIPRADEYASESAGTVPMKSMAEKMADGMAQMYQIANTQYAALMTVHEYLVPLLKDKGITIDPQQEAGLVQNMLIQMYYQKGHHFFPGKRLGQHRQQPTTNDETPPPAA